MVLSPVPVAGIADLHCTKSAQGVFQPLFSQINEAADVLLIAGDLTDYGLPDEARVLVRELTDLRIPVVAVPATTTSSPATNGSSGRFSATPGWSSLTVMRTRFMASGSPA